MYSVNITEYHFFSLTYLDSRLIYYILHDRAEIRNFSSSVEIFFNMCNFLSII